MRLVPLSIVLTLCWSHAWGQAPRSANLWRVTAASLTSPPALQIGPVGMAWNPAACIDESGLSGAVHIVQTSDVLGLSSVLVGLSRSAGRNGRVGLSGGRIDVRDLVRTSSSPNSEGTIPVYAQYLGLGGRFESHGLAIGGLLRLHNAQFDLEREHGFTLDFGARYRASSRLVVAAATHFLPIELSGRETSDYYAGLEFTAIPGVTIGRVAAQVLTRYGVTYKAAEKLEPMIGGGLTLGGHFGLDASMVREAGYLTGGWRPAVAVFFIVGKYQLEVARSNGLNDLGATYRIGLDAAIVR